jgi:hypothetical protein
MTGASGAAGAQAIGGFILSNACFFCILVICICISYGYGFAALAAWLNEPGHDTESPNYVPMIVGITVGSLLLLLGLVRIVLNRKYYYTACVLMCAACHTKCCGRKNIVEAPRV